MKNSHLDKFFQSNCLADLMPYYANYCDSKKRNKEITESVGIYEAALNHFGKECLDNSIVYVVGDGILPRTGSVFAHFGRCQVESIDPVMRSEYLNHYFDFKDRIERSVRRLEYWKAKAETFDFFSRLNGDEKIMLIYPHSHAPFEYVVKRLNREGFFPNVVNMPCCVRMKEKTKQKGKTFVDTDILSAKNSITVFDNLNLL